MPAFQIAQAGSFPHQAYRPSCRCMDGQAKESKNYAGHVVAPPRCSSCGAGYHLDIEQMPTFAAEPPKK